MSLPVEETIIQLFEVVGKELKPTRHCYGLKFLKVIMDKYPKDHIDVYKYIFYMTCPDPVNNPYFNMNEIIREETIIRDNDMQFDTEEPEILIAIAKCTKLYETPTVRLENTIRGVLDNMNEWMATSKFTSGRDGNVSEILKAAKEFKVLRDEYNLTKKDLHKEQKEHGKRGGGSLAYDLGPDSTRNDD